MSTGLRDYNGGKSSGRQQEGLRPSYTCGYASHANNNWNFRYLELCDMYIVYANKKEICVTNETVLSSCLYVVVHAQNISTISLLRSAWLWLPFDFYIISQTSFDNWLLYITPAFLCLLAWLFFQLSVSFGRDSQSSKLWGDLHVSHFHKQIYILTIFG